MKPTVSLVLETESTFAADKSSFILWVVNVVMLSGYASLVSGDYESSKQSASLIPYNLHKLHMHIVQLIDMFLLLLLVRLNT